MNGMYNVRTRVLVIGVMSADFVKLGVGESEWAFKSSFSVTEDELRAPNIDLVFDGLDTFATVDLVRLIISPKYFRSVRFCLMNTFRMGKRSLGAC